MTRKSSEPRIEGSAGNRTEAAWAAKAEVLWKRDRALVGDLLSPTIPLVQKGYHGMPVPSGTGLLLRIAGQGYLVTASHVFDPRIPNRPVVAIASERFVGIEGVRFRSRPDVSARAKDRVDLGIVRLSAASEAAFEGCAFVTARQIDPFLRQVDLAPTTGYLALGFANARQPRRVSHGEYASEAYHFFTHRALVEAGREIPFDPELHIALGCDRRDFVGVPSVQELVKPVGMSGGGIWRIPGLLLANRGPAQLVGIIIEFHETSAILLATQIRHVLRGMLENDPASRQGILTEFPGLFRTAA